MVCSCTVPINITYLYILKNKKELQNSIKPHGTITQWKVMQYAHSALAVLARRSNPAFIAAEKFSFHLIRGGWSSLLNENSWVQIFWESLSKNGPNCLTRVRIRLSVLYVGVCPHLGVGPLGLDLLSHLLCTAQQVIALPALQEEQTNTS